MKHIEDFLLHLEHGREVSPHTARAYRTDLERLSRHLGAAERTAPCDLGTPRLKTYLGDLLAAGYSRATVARHAAAIRAYFHYLLAEGFSDHDPAASLRLPRTRRGLPRVLDSQAMLRLLQAPVGEAFVALRDRALLETLYSAGLRVSELVSLDLDRVFLDRGILRVLGKGRRERLALLGRHAVQAIEAYLGPRQARAREPHERALFLNRLGTRLSDRSVRRTLARYIVRADLPPDVTPHTLRHSFASHLLQNGAGLKEVQELLGHKNLSSTQIYTHVSPEHLRRVYESAHPRAHAEADR